ncbi:alpha/beta hydrolase [Streptomyces sp. NPDC057242]|uniref:alpha/beta hydrolase n=1 Tax=unclassified Streptomyces TaxID=2593676 RepID=UPI00363F5B09
MRPFATSILRATVHDDVFLGHVRYRYRGWNDRHAHPVEDTHRALAELCEITGPVPVVLVGHSMGARAALRAVGNPRVTGVVALAPWYPPGEPTAHLAGRTLIALHDETDRVTRAVDTWSYLTHARSAGARVFGLSMPGGGHAMLRGARRWHRAAAGAAIALLGPAPLPAPLSKDSSWIGTPTPWSD